VRQFVPRCHGLAESQKSTGKPRVDDMSGALVISIPRSHSGLERMCPGSASKGLVLAGSDGGSELVVRLVNNEGLAAGALHDGANPWSILVTDDAVALPMTWLLSVLALAGTVVGGAHRRHEAGGAAIWTALAPTRWRFGTKLLRQSPREPVTRSIQSLVGHRRAGIAGRLICSGLQHSSSRVCTTRWSH
jgi:hypothetical protein